MLGLGKGEDVLALAHFSEAPARRHLSLRRCAGDAGRCEWARSPGRSGPMPSRATRKPKPKGAKLVLPHGVDGEEVTRIARSHLPRARPDQHAAQRHGAGRAWPKRRAIWRRSTARSSRSSVGEALVKANYPLIHAVGQGSDRAPRLDRYRLGPRRRAEGDAGRQGRVLRHRRLRPQAVVRHAVDEEGHGRRRHRARHRRHGDGREAGRAPARA